jgi:hypothetical protein
VAELAMTKTTTVTTAHAIVAINLIWHLAFTQLKKCRKGKIAVPIPLKLSLHRIEFGAGGDWNMALPKTLTNARRPAKFISHP